MIKENFSTMSELETALRAKNHEKIKEILKDANQIEILATKQPIRLRNTKHDLLALGWLLEAQTINTIETEGAPPQKRHKNKILDLTPSLESKKEKKQGIPQEKIKEQQLNEIKAEQIRSNVESHLRKRDAAETSKLLKETGINYSPGNADVTIQGDSTQTNEIKLVIHYPSHNSTTLTLSSNPTSNEIDSKTHEIDMVQKQYRAKKIELEKIKLAQQQSVSHKHNKHEEKQENAPIRTR